MRGAIRKWEIITHPVVTLRCFGWPVLVRALVARRDRTFLSLLAGPERVESSGLSDLLSRCVAIELQARNIYEFLARRFPESPLARQFFDTLVRQEQGHADMLGLCRELARGERATDDRFGAIRQAVPRIQRGLSEIHLRLPKVSTLEDAMLIVLQLERTEINRAFAAVVGAMKSPFLRSLESFQLAGVRHLAYISERVKEFAPQLAHQCELMVREGAQPLGGSSSQD